MSTEISEGSSELQDGQVVNSEPWADQVDDMDNESSDSQATVDEDLVSVVEGDGAADVAEEFELPDVLKQLMNVNGMRFTAVPEGTWNINGYVAKLRRFYSITFAVDDEVSSTAIVEALLKAGVEAEHIESIQFRNSTRSWCVTFTDQLSKEFILEKGVIHFDNAPVFVGDADFRVVIVKVYEAPPEMPDTVLIGRLSHYGRVLSFRRDRSIATHILNGVRTARMRLSKEIPLAIRLAGEPVFISYPGQPKTCRRCGDPGHLAQGCKNPHCFNCEAPGHRSADCPKDPLCCVCMKADHPVAECPFLAYSANVVNADEQIPTYAEAAKQNRSAAAPPPAGTSGSQSASQLSAGTSSREKTSSAEKTTSAEKTSSSEKRSEKSDKGDERSNDRERRKKSSDVTERDHREKSDREERDRQDKRTEKDPGSRRDRDDGRDSRDDHVERGSRRSKDWSHSRDRSSRDDYYRDRYYSRDHDRRRRRDYSPTLYTSEDSDLGDYDRDRDRRKRHRR